MSSTPNPIAAAEASPYTPQAQINTVPTLPGWSFPMLAASGAHYVTVDDYLFLNIANPFKSPAAISVVVRLLEPGGTLVVNQYIIDAPQVTDATIQLWTQQLAEGYLLDVCVVNLTPSAGEVQQLQHGEIFIMCGLLRGAATGTPYITCSLTQGYLTQSGALSWPGGPQELESTGKGAIKQIAIADPTPGDGISLQLPVGCRIRIVSFYTLFTASIAVASRHVYLLVENVGAVQTARFPTPTAIIASGSRFITFSEAANSLDDGLNMNAPIYSDESSTDGSNVFILAEGIDSGDQFSKTELVIEAWAEF